MADHLSLLLDPLYCQEQQWEAEEDHALPLLGYQVQEPAAAAEWAELLSSLAAKEGETHPELPHDYPDGGDENPYLRSARRVAVEWVARAAAVHGFSAVTVVLAVNYLDCCFLGGGSGLRLQADKPWMGRLSAVACLSLAAKVEETHVPLLLDLQAAAAMAIAAEDETAAGCVFEAKTVRRMELLVLSSLRWRMNPVTPLSFIHHVLPELVKDNTNAIAAAAAHQRELLRRCHAIMLSVITDWRWVRYPPSVWAGALLLHAMGLNLDLGSGGSSEYYETHHPLALLNLPKERVEGCYQLISESMGGCGCVDVGVKRKHRSSFYDDGYSSPPSPNGVIGSCFSCESSSIGGDSWAIWPSSVSSSPVPPPFKRPNCSIAGDSAGDDQDGEQAHDFAVFA